MTKISLNSISKQELLLGIVTSLKSANYSLARLLIDKYERLHGYPPGPLGEKDSFIRTVYINDWPIEASKTTFDREIKELMQATTTQDFVYQFLNRCIKPAINSESRDPRKPVELGGIASSKRLLCSVGSCFAREIAYACGKSGIYCYHFDFEEEISSPVTLNNYLKFLYSSEQETRNTYFSMLDPNAVTSAKKLLENASVIFLTLGVAIGPHNKKGQPVSLPKIELRAKLQTGDITLKSYDFNLLVESLESSINTLEKLPKKPKIFLTLSPVPLYAYYGTEMNVIVADSISKSLLRAAYETFLKRNDTVTYLPTFELFKNIANHVNIKETILKPFGEHDAAPRHPSRSIVEVIMQYVLSRYILI